MATDEKKRKEREEILEECRENIKGFLIGKKEGVSVTTLMNLIEESTDKRFPFRKLGYNTVEEFLVTLDDIIDVRRIPGDNKPYLFIKPSCITPNLFELRRQILGQKAVSRKGKTTPTLFITRSVPITSLLRRSSHYDTTPSNPIYPPKPPVPGFSQQPSRYERPGSGSGPSGFSSFDARCSRPSTSYKPLYKPRPAQPTFRPLSSLMGSNIKNNFIGIAPLSGKPMDSTYSTLTYNGVQKENTNEAASSSKPSTSYSQAKETNIKRDTSRFYTPPSQPRNPLMRYDDDKYEEISRKSSISMSSGRQDANRLGAVSLCQPPDSDSEDSDDFDFVSVPRGMKGEMKSMANFSKTISNDLAKPQAALPIKIETTKLDASIDLELKKSLSMNVMPEKPSLPEIKKNGLVNGIILEDLMKEQLDNYDIVQIIHGDLTGSFLVGPPNYNELKDKLDTHLKGLRTKGSMRVSFCKEKILVCASINGIQRAIARLDEDTEKTYLHFIDTGSKEVYNENDHRTYLADLIDPKLNFLAPLVKNIHIDNLNYPNDPSFKIEGFITFANTHKLKLRITDTATDIIVVRPKGFDRLHRLIQTYVKKLDLME